MPAVVVLGGRNLGGAVLDRFVANGWAAAGVSRGPETLLATQARGALGYQADVREPAALADVLDRARKELGGLDVVVNAVSVAAPRPGEVFGGGPIADASIETLHRWASPVLDLAFVFLSEGARALRATGGSWGTLVQITNGLSRRPEPGRGLWAAGHAALRTLVHAAAQELRPEGIRACLLVVDAPIDSSKTAQRMVEDGVPASASADQAEVAEAAWYLATRGPRGLSYELTVTAADRPWLP